MLNPGVVYMLTSVVLCAVAVVVHFHTTHLSLPLSPAITVLAVVLPIAAFVNAYIYPNLLRASHACAADGPRNLPARLAPYALQGLQALVTAVLAALLLEGVVPSPALDLVLEREWDTLFAARDARSLRIVQDTYRCCGLDAPDDRAYPFDGAETCADLYDRTASCMAPWRGAMLATSALDFGAVLAVGLMQVVGLLMMRERTPWWTDLRTQRWKQGDVDDDNSSHQALLSPADEETAPRREATLNEYGAVRADETASRAEADRDTSSNQ